MVCCHLLAPPQYPRVKKPQYFTAVCPLQPVFTGWDDTQGRMYPAGGQFLGRSVVTKSSIGGNACSQALLLGRSFIGAALVALEELVFCFSCSFLCFHVACHLHSPASSQQGLAQLPLLLQLYLGTKEKKALPSLAPALPTSRCQHSRTA